VQRAITLTLSFPVSTTVFLFGRPLYKAGLHNSTDLIDEQHWSLCLIEYFIEGRNPLDVIVVDSPLPTTLKYER